MADAPTSPNEPQAEPPVAPAIYGFSQDATRLLPWSHAESRLDQARNYWLATTRPDGRPHVTPLWGVWVDGALYFDGMPTTRWDASIGCPHGQLHSVGKRITKCLIRQYWVAIDGKRTDRRSP